MTDRDHVGRGFMNSGVRRDISPLDRFQRKVMTPYQDYTTAYWKSLSKCAEAYSRSSGAAAEAPVSRLSFGNHNGWSGYEQPGRDWPVCCLQHMPKRRPLPRRAKASG